MLELSNVSNMSDNIITKLTDDIFYYMLNLETFSECDRKNFAATCHKIFNLYTLNFSTSPYGKISQLVDFIDKELAVFDKDIDEFNSRCSSGLGLARKNGWEYAKITAFPFIVGLSVFLGVIFLGGSVDSALNVTLPILVLAFLYRKNFLDPKLDDKALLTTVDETDLHYFKRFVLSKHGFFSKVNANYSTMNLAQIFQFMNKIFADLSTGLNNLKSFQKDMFEGENTSLQLEISSLHPEKSGQTLLKCYIDQFNKIKRDNGQKSHVISYEDNRSVAAGAAPY